MASVQRAIRVVELVEGDSVKVNTRPRTKPVTVTKKEHLGDNVWRLTLNTGEVRTYQAMDWLVLVTKETS